MHRTEGPDFVTVGGNRRFGEVLPATVIDKDIMNAVQEELALAVENSGQTLRTTGALDESGAWGQLTEAIKRLPLVQPEDVTVTLVTGVITSLAPTLAQNFLRIERAGGIASPGFNVVFPNDVAYNGRIITIRNSASRIIQIKDRRGCLSMMAHHAVEQFYCFLDDDAANYNWAPMSGVYSGTYDTTVDYTDPVSSTNVTVFYQKRGCKIDLYLPFIGLSIDGGPTNVVTIALPPFLHGQNNSRPKIILSDGTSTPVWTSGSFPSGGPSGGDLLIGGIVSTAHELEAQWVSYLADNELVA